MCPGLESQLWHVMETQRFQTLKCFSEFRVGEPGIFKQERGSWSSLWPERAPGGNTEHCGALCTPPSREQCVSCGLLEVTKKANQSMCFFTSELRPFPNLGKLSHLVETVTGTCKNLLLVPLSVHGV